VVDTEKSIQITNIFQVKLKEIAGELNVRYEGEKEK
jgi:hypothetical protein